jgi:hypothetical protein
MPVTKPTDFNILESYIEPIRRKFIACSLLTFAFKQFSDATIINELEKIINFYRNNEQDYILKNFPVTFKNVLFDSLIDSIKIGICFENYFKAKLLLNGFIIHKIKVNNKLLNAQKERPVSVNEITELTSAEAIPILANNLQQTTINYSWLLEKSDYYRHFDVDSALIDFLKQLNNKRNELHLMLGERVTLSRAIVSNYRMLNSKVKVDVPILQNTLLTEVAPQSKTKLPVDLTTLDNKPLW